MVVKKQISWTWIERTIYAITIVGGLFFHFRDKAVTDALNKQEVEGLKSELLEVNKQLTEEKAKWQLFDEWHGKVDMYITIDSDRRH